MRTLISFSILLCTIFSLSAQTPAFPGAEGGGKYTTGGRGGDVYYVNSLEDTITGNKKTREGTLRWCLKRPEPRIILFKVGGIIRLKKSLNIPSNTTIAGQTAPGDGICIADYPVKIKGNNIIVRFLRFRMGDLTKVQDDAFSGNNNQNLIIDHCSVSWSTDECASFYDNENFTMQWSIISESLRASVHKKGQHGYGAIWGGKKASYHHNLLAHHDSRNPRMCGSRYSARPDLELVDFRNNVIYNWGANSAYAGEGGQYNIVNNYYKAGEETSNKNRIFAPNADDGSNAQEIGTWGRFFIKGNYIHNSSETTQNNILGFQPNPKTKAKQEILSDAEFNTPTINTESAEDAYINVLQYAGASHKRDKTDMRVVNEVRLGLTPKRASNDEKTRAGLIDSQQDVGGWEIYSFETKDVPADSNTDGIPDNWLEKNYPGKAANDTNEDGYPYLEVYLNQLVNHIIK